MESYFISPPEATDLKINTTELAESLRSQWQDVKIHYPDNPARHYALEWILQMPQMQLDCYLEKKQQVVILEGDIEDCAKFALWFRSQVSNQYKLLFYNEGYSSSVELDLNTTEEQLLKPFLI